MSLDPCSGFRPGGYQGGLFVSLLSLFVRLETSFWTHRKTLRLRSLLGEAAYWIPPRLWCYAAENQSDGDFTGYSAEELAHAIGYSGNASSMLEALHQAGYMDAMRIPGWAERNAYHATYAARAKKAATTRWDRERAKKTAPVVNPPPTPPTLKTSHSLESESEQACLKHDLPLTPPIKIVDTETLIDLPDSAPGLAPPVLLWVKGCAQHMVPEWYAREKFEYFDSVGWRQGQTPLMWKRCIPRVKSWYDCDGRPKEPRRTNGSPHSAAAIRERNRDNEFPLSGKGVPVYNVERGRAEYPDGTPAE